MPKVYDTIVLDVTPERFLNACSQTELVEVQLLLHSNRFQKKMRGEKVEESYDEQVLKALSNAQ